MRQVVIFKTHLWNNDIETFAKKILLESKNIIDFYILMHDENGKIYDHIMDDAIRAITIIFTQNEIQKLYPEGFYNMWLSNHWILMWFFKKFPKYNYYWSIEYDVRIVGNSNFIWQYSGVEDFIYPRGNYISPSNPYYNHYTGKLIADNKKRQGSLQIARYSQKFLEYLDKNFLLGENGQDELIIFSLANHGNFTTSSQFLGAMIKGYWTWDPQFIPQNNYQYQKLLKMVDNLPAPATYILHPVK